MSNTATERRTFGEASAKKMPTLACIGRVSEVGEGHISQSGKFVVQPIALEGYGASRSITFQFLYRPEWFRAGFRPDKLEEMEGGAKILFVYRKNISERGGISALLGLCGGDEAAFDGLAGRLFDLEEVTPESVQDVLHNAFLLENEGREVGYILKQQRTDTGEKDEDGKKIYISEPYYEVESFFVPDTKTRKKLEKRAERSEGRFKVLFSDDEVPY